MYVCDTSLNCYSDDPSTAMLELDLTGNPLSPSSFTLSGATDQGLPAPVVTTAGTTMTTPEPASVFLVGSSMLLAAAVRRKSPGSRSPSFHEYGIYVNRRYNPSARVSILRNAEQKFTPNDGLHH